MKTTRSELTLLLTLLGGCGSSADAGFELAGRHYADAGLTQWALPDELREVSGLALTGDGRLFAHGDEHAVIVELDFASGRAVKRFAFGNPPVAGDFEGIAFAGPRLFLITSAGELLEGREGEAGEHVDFQRHDTGLGQRCEIEGLDHDPDQQTLLILCKQGRQRELAGTIAVLAWSLAARQPTPGADLVRCRDPAAGGSAPGAADRAGSARAQHPRGALRRWWPPSPAGRPGAGRGRDSAGGRRRPQR